jgi:hypothetical protein
MKKLSLLFLGSLLLVALFAAGTALAAPQQGLLVDKNGDPVEGYSHVWIDNGVAYPVYNPTTQMWYNVFIIGTGENGVVLCTLGKPLGTVADFHGGYEEGEHILMPDADDSYQ